MLQKLRERSQSESGFTLVELLVVMLIIGLLAAIAIPAFFNQRDKARDASAKEAVRTAQTAMETYSTDNNGSYSGATLAKLRLIEPTVPTTTIISDSGSTTAGDPSATAYRVMVPSSTGNTFSIDRASNSSLSYPCTAANDGGCGASVWN